jgi:DNA-binding response OmpR family regulator
MVGRLIVVEDDSLVADALGELFRVEGYVVEKLLSGAEAAIRFERPDFDAAILDLGLPDADGMALIQMLRARSSAPILVLTGTRGAESRALGLGADDYVHKPFSNDELVARIGALIRRASSPRWSPLSCGLVVLHPDERAARVNGRTVGLSQRERELLEYLLRRQQQVVSREEILLDVFGQRINHGTNVVDVHIAHIRRKLSGGQVVLEAVRGIGYRIRPA